MRDEHETASAAREAQAAEVLIEALPDDALAAPLLVVDDVDGQLRGALPRAVRWSRVANGALSGEAAAWAPAGPHPGATLRMPKAKAALDLALHAVASTLPAGAPLWLYGANDEGIRSVAGRLDGLFEGVEAVSAKRRCRVWQARRGAGAARAPLSAWRAVSRLALPGGAVEWVEYPGVFAAGRLDEATAVLLGTMAPVAAGARVLDYGCGAGVIGAAIRQRAPDAKLHLLDADAVAVEAARENVPGAAVYVSDGFGATPGLVLDRIVSNPPIHRGKREDYSALVALIEEAPRHLARGGALELVVQRRLTVKPWIDAVFARVEPLFLDGRWQVWRASAPRAESTAAR